MRPIALALGIIALLFAPLSAEALPTTQGKYKILGAGADSCRAWITNHSVRNAFAIAEDSWIFGYVTAVNRIGPGPEDTTRDADNDAITSWIAKYCSTNPAKTVAAATLMMMVTIGVNGGLPAQH